MNRGVTAAAVAALALLSFFIFPGHTWLQQDSQIYAPILENQRDASLLRNDLLVQRPHVAYTVYDEVALALRGATGLSFREVLQAQQIVTRALGIWGIYLLASALGLGMWQALAVAAVGALGAAVAGPSVLTFEYEPTPRAFAVPLLMLAMGLTAGRRYVEAGVAAGAAFVYHPLTAIPFWGLFVAVALIRRKPMAIAPLAASAAILMAAAHMQAGEGTAWFGRLTAADAAIERLRASYVWVSTWPLATVLHHLVVFAILCAAYWRAARKAPLEIAVFLLGLPLVGLLAMPISWVLLEQWHWALVPQVQPLRILLFGVFAMVVMCAAAGVSAAGRGRVAEAAAWLLPAYWIAVQSTFTAAVSFRLFAVSLGLALATALARRYTPAVAVAALVIFPVAGGVALPRLHTPELRQLSDWARSSTPRDAVFAFPDAFRGLAPGIFRAEALRAVYVDWKGGGQVNYLKGFGEIWLERWQQTMPRRFNPSVISRLEGRGIDYIVLQARDKLPRQSEFENADFAVYRLGGR